MDNAKEQDAEIGDRLRGWSLALLFLAAATNLFDHQVAHILAQDIKAEFGLSDAKLDLLIGTATGGVTLIVAVPFGYLVDRTNRLHLIVGTVAAWSLCTMACGLVGSYVQLFAARLGAGIGGAALGPAGSSVVADLFPDKKRTSAMAIMLLGSSIGAFLGLLIGGYLGTAYGWRTAFVIAGVPGLLLAPLMLFTMREPRRVLTNAAANAATEAQPFRQTLKTLAGNSIFLGMVAASTCAQFMVYVAGSWLPPFLIRARDMSTVEAGAASAVALGLGGALGLLGAGITCDLLRPRIRHIEVKFMMSALALAVPALLITVMIPAKALALPAMFLFGMCGHSVLPVTINIIQHAAGPYARGFAIALNTAIGLCLGLAVGVPLVGLASDHLTPTYGPQALGYAVATTGAVGLLGLIPLSFVLWRMSQGAARSAPAGLEATR